MATPAEALAAAVDRHQAGDVAAAETLYRRIIDAAPTMAAAWHYFALLLGQNGRLNDCAAALARATALVPAETENYRQRAKALAAAGDRRGAFAMWRWCARLTPDDAEAPHGAGVAALALNDGGAATAFLLRAAALNPQRADDLPALLALLGHQGDWRRVDAVARRLTAMRPDDGEGWDALGVAAVKRKNKTAAAALRRAALLTPTQARRHVGLARHYRQTDQLDDADAALRRALSLAPADAETLYDAAELALHAGDSTGAARLAAQAAALTPDDSETALLQIVIGLYADDVKDAKRRFQRHLAFADRLPRPPARPVRARTAGDPLRVGYVSTDLWGARPVVRNMLPVLRRNDRFQTPLFFYVDAPGDDPTTAELSRIGAWRNVTGRTDAAVADMIRADGVDVLVFLAGHFDRNRATLALLRPAAAQISFLDVATSGLAAMDFLIADRMMVPPTSSEGFVERPLRLPHYYMADPPQPAPPVNALPAFDNGFVTFASFNNPTKLSDATLDLWGRLLARLPGARLRLRYFEQFDQAIVANRVRRALAAHGVAPDRLEFPRRAGVDRNDHLKLYHGVDIGLDPFPFNGSTTTFEALCMGVPVVTLACGRMVGRWGASLLDAIKLNQFIARSPDDYLAVACAAAADLHGLAALRATLRARAAASPLTDAGRKARELQRLYRAAWARVACANKAR